MGDFQNMIICDDWAAIYYWYVKTDFETGERTPWDGMYFYHFEKDGSKVKLLEKILKINKN